MLVSPSYNRLRHSYISFTVMISADHCSEATSQSYMNPGITYIESQPGNTWVKCLPGPFPAIWLMRNVFPDFLCPVIPMMTSGFFNCLIWSSVSLCMQYPFCLGLQVTKSCGSMASLFLWLQFFKAICHFCYLSCLSWGPVDFQNPIRSSIITLGEFTGLIFNN